MAEHIYSNPVYVYINHENVGYTYIPKGIEPFCVRMEKDNWIPVNVMVFSDTADNATEQVIMALEWQASQLLNKRGSETILAFLREATIRVEPITRNQLFKIGWAANDNISVS